MGGRKQYMEYTFYFAMMTCNYDILPGCYSDNDIKENCSKYSDNKNIMGITIYE